MSSEKVPNPIAASGGGGGVAPNTKTSPPHGVEFAKGINGLDKVVLHDPRGSLAEVLH